MTHLQDLLDQKLLDHPDIEDIYVIRTGPVMVRTKDGCRILATELTPPDGQPGDPG